MVSDCILPEASVAVGEQEAAMPSDLRHTGGRYSSFDQNTKNP